MRETLKLLAILAHPDDETLGFGGALAKYAGEGVETYLVTATRGEEGWPGQPEDYPGAQELGRIREAELYAAAETLGLREVFFLDYRDGQLDQARPDEVIHKLVTQIRRIKPQVVVTFDPVGSYGHPDHIAISQFTLAAILGAADPTYHPQETLPTHRVSKLYYRATTSEELATYETVFGDLVMQVDGVERQAAGWKSWSVTSRIDTSEYWHQVWQAVACHRSQLPDDQFPATLPEEQRKKLWTSENYYRVLSLVNGGRTIEEDLFEGLRK